MNSTEPLVRDAQKVLLLWLDLQAKLHAPCVQQELLLRGLGPENALNAKQELMKSTEPPVLTVHRVPFLWLVPQAKLHVMHAPQEVLLNGLEPKNAFNVKQGLTKPTEPHVLTAQRVPFL